ICRPLFGKEAARASGQPLWDNWPNRRLLLAGSNLSGNFGSEVGLGLLDTLAHFVTNEGNDFGTGFLHQVTDLDFRIHDEGLLDQAGFGQELGDTAFDHVLYDVFRLAGDLLGVQLQEDFLFLGNQLFGNLVRRYDSRVGGSDVHGNVLGQFIVAAFQDNQNTDAVAVQVGTHGLAGNGGQTTDVDVLAALGNQSFTSRFAGSDQRSSVGQVLVEGFVDALFDESLEVVLQSQEVGLRVDFDDHATATFNANGDRAFSGDVAGLLGSLDGTGSAHVINGFLDVATSSNQGLLAFHHAFAGTLAQFFNQGCSNLCHLENPLGRSSTKSNL